MFQNFMENPHGEALAIHECTFQWRGRLIVMYGVKKLIIINADCMVPNKKKDWSLEGFSFFFINRIKEKDLLINLEVDRFWEI